MPSGVPFLKNAIQVGFTDFSEFSVGAGLPSGITEFGITPTSPQTLAIANDATEGNYFSMEGHGFRTWGFGLDSFFGKMLTGELLARVWFEIPVNGRKTLGPAATIQGLIGGGEPGADFENWSGGFYRQSNELTGAFSTDTGQTSDVSTTLTPGGWQDEVWAWVRIRRVESTNPAQDDWQATAWFGALEDEPGSPDTIRIGGTRAPIYETEAVGWVMPGAGYEADQRIAFLSFSADPVLAAPPVPGEGAATWVPSNVPGASSWVPSNV